MSGTDASTPTWLDLYDWRARVARMYRERDAALRRGDAPDQVCQRFRATRDALFKGHPQSPLNAEQRASFTGLPYFAYDPVLRIEGRLEPDASDSDVALDASGAHAMRFRRAGHITFTLEGTDVALKLYWIDVYGGGLFLPFRDTTSGTETYGGGRYLVDSVKGSDFIHTREAGEGDAPGYAGGTVIVDFNYAYNPSCAYDARWVCPLAPNENRLPVATRVGEQVFEAH